MVGIGVNVELVGLAQTVQLLIEPDRELDYQRILQRSAKRYAQRENTDLDVELSLLDQLDEQFRKLREQLLEVEAAADPDGRDIQFQRLVLVAGEGCLERGDDGAGVLFLAR